MILRESKHVALINNTHNKVLLCLTDISLYIYICVLNTSGWQTLKFPF